MTLRKANILTILLILIVAFGYARNKKLSKTDIASMYTEENFTGFDTKIYHTSDEKSTVFLNVKLHHFTYKQVDDITYEANYRVAYELYESYDSKNPLDTASFVYSDQENYGQEAEVVVDFDVKAAFPGTFVIKIILTDLNASDHSVFRFENIHKASRFSAQNFFLTDENEYPLFGNFVLQDRYFRVQYNNPDTQQLVIRYYKKTFPLAKPPFSIERNITYSFEADSFYTINLTQGMSHLLELPHHGIYHIQAKTGQREGLTLFRFDDGYPDVSDPAQALAPLRYLTTEREFEKLLSYSDYKTAVDSFWLDRSSFKPDRAKNMIKRYYSRVQEVNRIFTSYQEGWKTDRGLIYIIYGPPSEVYRNNKEEEWIYGEKGNPMSIRFYFHKSDNPFTDNSYNLHRLPVYKSSWYIAIENWRR